MPAVERHQTIPPFVEDFCGPLDRGTRLVLQRKTGRHYAPLKEAEFSKNENWHTALETLLAAHGDGYYRIACFADPSKHSRSWLCETLPAHEPGACPTCTMLLGILRWMATEYRQLMTECSTSASAHTELIGTSYAQLSSMAASLSGHSATPLDIAKTDAYRGLQDLIGKVIDAPKPGDRTVDTVAIENNLRDAVVRALGDSRCRELSHKDQDIAALYLSNDADVAKNIISNRLQPKLNDILKLLTTKEAMKLRGIFS